MKGGKEKLTHLGQEGHGPAAKGWRRRGGLVVLIILFLLGGGNNSNSGVTSADQSSVSGQDKELADFVSVVLADTEDAWTKIFADNNRQYQPPTLMLFSGAVDAACGFAQSTMGPFYCPSDEKMYIDLSFYRLERQVRRPRRLCLGVRHCTRGRPPRAKPAWNIKQGAEHAAGVCRG